MSMLFFIPVIIVLAVFIFRRDWLTSSRSDDNNFPNNNYSGNTDSSNYADVTDKNDQLNCDSDATDPSDSSDSSGDSSCGGSDS